MSADDHVQTNQREGVKAQHKSDRWSDLRLRFLSAAVLAPVALSCIWIGGAAFSGLVLLVSLALVHEWLALCQVRLRFVSVTLFAALPVSVGLAAADAPFAGLLLLALAFLLAFLLRARIGGTWQTPWGIPYLGIACVALQWLRADPAQGRATVIVLLLIVWASDIGAYVVGRAVGGRKLAPAISPGKTLSGAVGGLVAAMLVGAIASVWVGSAAPAMGAVWSCLIAAVSQAGDLFESYLKRQFGVKDSGRLIPGHGGVLDRLDALIVAAPFAALLAFAVGRGVVIW